MFSDYLKDNIQFVSAVSDWKEAINLAAQPLLKADIIEKSYIDAMINNVIENGSYIIILPNIAMPHARFEYGSHGIGISFLNLSKPVVFPNGDSVYQFFVLAANSSDRHLELISELAMLLSDVDIYNKILKVHTKEELINIIEENE